MTCMVPIVRNWTWKVVVVMEGQGRIVTRVCFSTGVNSVWCFCWELYLQHIVLSVWWKCCASLLLYVGPQSWCHRLGMGWLHFTMLLIDCVTWTSFALCPFSFLLSSVKNPVRRSSNASASSSGSGRVKTSSGVEMTSMAGLWLFLLFCVPIRWLCCFVVFHSLIFSRLNLFGRFSVKFYFCCHVNSSCFCRTQAHHNLMFAFSLIRTMTILTTVRL